MKLLEALAELTQEDLDSFVKREEELTAELEQIKEIRKLIEIRLGVRKPPGHHLKGRKAKKSTEEDSRPSTQSGNPHVHSEPEEVPDGDNMTLTDRYRLRVKHHLMANGPTRGNVIAKTLGIPLGSMGGVLNHKWFKSTADGIQLTVFAQG